MTAEYGLAEGEQLFLFKSADSEWAKQYANAPDYARIPFALGVTLGTERKGKTPVSIIVETMADDGRQWLCYVVGRSIFPIARFETKAMAELFKVFLSGMVDPPLMVAFVDHVGKRFSEAAVAAHKQAREGKP